MIAACLTALFFATASAPAAERMPTITVRAPQRAYHNAIVTATWPLKQGARFNPSAANALVLETRGSKEKLRCQMESDGKQLRLTFVLPDLPKGATRVYRLRLASPLEQVNVTQKEGDIEIKVGGALFTRYTTKSAPNKPIFYPILTPDGQPMTRRWPMESNTPESHDHPHHRGLWFTHGSVNGLDFWSETPKTGKTVNKAFSMLMSGAVFGGFHTETEWRTPDDKLLATDARDVRIYALPNGDRVLDFAIEIKPTDEPLVFGDTKEGMFGLRVPDSLASRPDRSAHIAMPTGHLESSTGNKDAAVWGKPAEWVDNWGPINGQTYGVAIFDHPSNLRHPQTWHARDYGLFTINPFGLHDFGLGPKGAGDYTVPKESRFTLRYRVLFHKGDTATAQVSEQYAAYATPPEVEIRE